MEPYDLSMRGQPIKEFASKHGLRTKRDECEELCVPAKRGQIIDHRDGRFGVMILNDTVMGWGYARKKMLRAGFQLLQNGDVEGTCLFDPEDARQKKVAIEVVKPYRRKQYSPEALERMLERLEKARGVQNSLVAGAALGQDSIASLE